MGKQIRSRALSGPAADAKIVAVLRGRSVIVARPETVFQPGDRLLLIAPPLAQEGLQTHLALATSLNPQTTGTTALSRKSTIPNSPSSGTGIMPECWYSRLVRGIGSSSPAICSTASHKEPPTETMSNAATIFFRFLAICAQPKALWQHQSDQDSNRVPNGKKKLSTTMRRWPAVSTGGY